MCLYYITFSDAETAEAVGRALLEHRLAVCVNVNFIGEITPSRVNRGFLEWLSRETGRHLEED